ncbi:MAG: hypothetical protein AB7O68_05595 [Pirellulales bacterium]
MLNDDLNFLQELGMARTGRITWFEYALGSHGPHLMPLWQTAFWLEATIFGMDFWKWRIAISVLHVLTAVMAYALLRRYLLTGTAATLAATLWAIGTASGGLDNPLLWIMCGHYSLSLLGLLVAMYCVAGAGSQSGGLRVAGNYFAGFTAIGAWSTVTFAWPAVLLQIVLSYPRLKPRFPRWIVAWSTVFVVGMLSVAFIVSVSGGERVNRLALGEAFLRTGAILTNSLATITLERAPELGWLTTEMKSHPLDHPLQAGYQRLAAIHLGRGWAGTRFGWHGLQTNAVVAAVVASLVVLLVRGRVRWGVLAVTWGGCLSLALITSLGGSARSVQECAQYGRYLYYPTLAWCVTLGVAIDSLLSRPAVQRLLARRGARLSLSLVTVLAFTMVLVHQRYAAGYSREVFDWLAHDTSEDYQSQLGLIEQLGALEGQATASLEVVDYPAKVTAPGKDYWPASALAAACTPGLRIRFIPCSKADESQIRETLRILDKVDSPAARQVAATLEPFVQQVQLLLWLDDFAKDERIQVRLPRMKVNAGERSFACSELLASERTTSGQGVVCDHFSRPMTPEELQILRQKLGQRSDPRAGIWLSILPPAPGPAPPHD